MLIWAAPGAAGENSSVTLGARESCEIEARTRRSLLNAQVPPALYEKVLPDLS